MKEWTVSSAVVLPHLCQDLLLHIARQAIPALDHLSQVRGQAIRKPVLFWYSSWRARAILDERGRRPFRSVADLRRVNGVGPKTLARIAPLLAVPEARGAKARPATDRDNRGEDEP